MLLALIACAQQTVVVTGQVKTVGFQTYPTAVTIIDNTTNAPLVVPVARDGVFSIRLPKHQSYRVVVSWTGLLGVSGTCNASVLTTAIESNSMPYSSAC